MRPRTAATLPFLSLISVCWLGCDAQFVLSEEDSASAEWSEQTIPLEPVREHPFNLGAVGELSEDGAELSFSGSVSYALGPGYPTTITQTMREGRWTSCGSLRGHYLARSVEGSSDAVRARLDAAGELVLTLHAEGSATLILKGEYEVPADGPECGFAPSSRVPVTDVMVVYARRPTQLAMQLPDCYDAPILRVATNVRVVPSFGLVDANGELFQPRNASPQRPATLTVRSAEPMEPVQLTAADGVAGTLSLMTPAAEGVFELRAPFGPATVVEVVGPERVTASSEFGIELKTWAAITSGDTVDLHWAEAIQVLTFDEMASGTKLCSGLDDAWFTLESDTPEVCSVEPKPADSADHRLTDAAVVYASGACKLKLTAPELGGGGGLSHELAVQVEKP